MDARRINAVPSSAHSNPSLTTQTQSTTQQTPLGNDWDQLHGDSFRVVVRLRPLSELEVGRGDAIALRSQDSMVIAPSDRGDLQAYQFNSVFDGYESQETVFQSSGVRAMIDMAMEGYATTVFAFGQTGSGKTYTISGPEHPSDPNKRGLMARTVEYVFSNMKREFTYKIRASYLEIYNEQVRDLLNPDGTNLGVRWSSQKNAFYVENLLVCECSSPEDLTAVVEEGMRNRTVGSHVLNKDSSRSHGMLTIHIDIESTDDITNQTITRFGKISFVDLAGSEKVKETKSSGETLKETQSINRSLFTLGVVISTLGNLKKRDKHIPYRDSKLTKLLMDSLGGNGATLMIACCSPSSYNLEESLRTLMYATRAKNIKNKPIVQMDPRDLMIMQLRREIQLLRAELEYFRGQRMGQQGSGEFDPRKQQAIPQPNQPPIFPTMQSSLSNALEMARGMDVSLDYNIPNIKTHTPAVSKYTHRRNHEICRSASGSTLQNGPAAVASGSASSRRGPLDLSNITPRDLQTALRNSEDIVFKCMQENERLLKEISSATRSKELAEKQYRSVMEENDRLSHKLEQLEDIFLDSNLPEEASKWGMTATSMKVTSKSVNQYPQQQQQQSASFSQTSETMSTRTDLPKDDEGTPRKQPTSEFGRLRNELERSIHENNDLRQTVAQLQQRLVRQEKDYTHRQEEQVRQWRTEVESLKSQLEKYSKAETERLRAFEEFREAHLPPNPNRSIQEENHILRQKIKDLYNENKYFRMIYNEQ